MPASPTLLRDLQSEVTRLEDALRRRCEAEPAVDAPLRAEYEAAKARRRTAQTYAVWRGEELTQAAVAWVLATVFLRFLEDNGLLETPVLSGPGPRLQRARDEQELYFRLHPAHTEREYLQHAFSAAAALPGLAGFFDRRHNPLWRAAPSGDDARELLLFWQRTDPASGLPLHDFTDPAWDTRFLGDLYQDLSAAARKKYALLQTPDFIEAFILDRTLTPALETFGLETVRLIDPTCGSGHFCLGAFHRLFRLWQQQHPGENPRVLAQNALNGVHGVDLNPFAVAIARFRLLLAALQVCHIRRLKDAPDFQLHLATGDSLLHGRRFGHDQGKRLHDDQPLFALQQTLGDDDLFRDELKHHYEVEDIDALHRILGQQYHAVVGNPPYITVKDRAVSELYRARFPTCSGKYSLAVPFMERFFDLAVKGGGTPQQPAGFVGQITSNSFMKREFGKKLIEEYLPRWDVTHVLDTAGAYIPGHGTPTVILLGKNQPPMSDTIRTVLGIRGEPATPAEPALGLVWQAIVIQIDEPGSVSEWVSAADSQRAKFQQHPWSIGGGGAAELKEQLEEEVESMLGAVAADWGITAVTGEDDVYVAASKTDLDRLRIERTRTFVTGDQVRDFLVTDASEAIWIYDAEFKLLRLNSMAATQRLIWPYRTGLSKRKRFGTPMVERGFAWYEWQELYAAKLRTPLVISFAFVATHNHFILSSGGKVFNRTAPAIKLPEDASEVDHARLIGLLNSSAACFWMKQVFHNKGSTVDQHGARQRTAPFEDFYEHDAGKLAKFPIPTRQPEQLPTALVQTSTALQAESPAATLAGWSGPGSGSLRSRLAVAREQAAHLRACMIALQEELDWQIYEAYGLVGREDGVGLTEEESEFAVGNLQFAEPVFDSPPNSKLPSPNSNSSFPSSISHLPSSLPPLNLGERAFEIVLARKMAAGEAQTTWFARHGSVPITELPAHWPSAYRERVERRIRKIEQDANIRLIEQPEYKRRWNTEPWDEQLHRAARDGLLTRLETYFFGGERMLPSSSAPSSIFHLPSSSSSSSSSPNSDLQTPTSDSSTSSPNSKLQTANSDSSSSSSSPISDLISSSFRASQAPALVSVNELAEAAQHDPAFLELAAVLEGGEGFSVSKVVRELVAGASVPNLPVDRYQASGLSHRRDWERTWELQRQEDAIDADVGVDAPGLKDFERAERVARAKRLKRERIGDIPVPPKYKSADFRKSTYWSLRGKLDVPKERWVVYPGAERDGDASPMIAWAGWDHLQLATALAAHYLDAKQNQTWPAPRLHRLLAGLLDLLPWLRQWHNQPDPDIGMGMGDYFAGFLEGECRAQGITLADLENLRWNAMPNR